MDYLTLIMVLIIIYNFYVSSKLTFGMKIALFLKSLFYQSLIAKIVHLQNKTFLYLLGGHFSYIHKSVELLV
jgi:hypothetical protein